MATSDILGLFTSPEDYQAQQAANDQQRAVAFSSMDPRQLANYSLFMGGQQLGRGLAGVFGVQDPQLQRIRQRQEIMQTINPADPDSLMAGIQRASQAGDQELALTLADYTRKARGDLALAQQREREKVPEAIQISEEIRKLTVQRDALPEGAERNAIDAQIKRLEIAKKSAGSTETPEYKNAFQLTVAENPTLDTESADFKTKFAANFQNLVKKGGDKTFESIVRAERIGTLMDELEILKAENKQDTPEYRRKASVLKSLQGDKPGAPIKEQVLAEEIVKLDAFIRNAKNPDAPEVIDAKTKVQLYRDAMKKDKPNLDVVGIAKEGKYAGTAVFLDESARKTFVFGEDKDGKQIEIPYTGGYTKLKGGTDISVGGAEVKVDTGAASKAAGKKIGEELVDVKDKQSALDSIDDALVLIKQGIYAGAYSDIRKGSAKYVGIGSKDKVARTEEFTALIGEVVIPRLRDFGGSDSNEELKYLNRVVGGDLEVEPEALERILRRAYKKIERGIERLRKQAESGERKESLTSTLPPATNAQPPAAKPTMRYNPATKKLERVK